MMMLRSGNPAGKIGRKETYYAVYAKNS